MVVDVAVAQTGLERLEDANMRLPESEAQMRVEQIVDFEDEWDGLSEEEMLRGLSYALNLLCCKNDRLWRGLNSSNFRQLAIFCSSQRQVFDLGFYLERFSKYMNCSNIVFVAAFALLDLAQRRYPAIGVNSFNVHRLFTAAVVLAAKFLDDDVYTNRYYAQIAGVRSVHEMNALELQMLGLLGWNVNIPPRTLRYYSGYLRLAARAALKEQ
eukprot:CAMPEP_0113953758 /NCGR_PEP_ID=MMETSP0011_2-20120614/21_1 /TAXON_ID=101924 /ORGANISM="Rhodosorus marinus" /LENGTH=211 /DNA_ID=CAMNT_0000962503 /DNA_START=346 /DNA_END=981 /DNA_ORIENTATION=+ /assembly_acc=CAM_ASM_000156